MVPEAPSAAVNGPCPVRSRRGRLPALAIGLIAAGAAAPAASQEPVLLETTSPRLDALFAMGIDELLTVRVTTAARHEEPRWRSANSVTVIRGDTLRLYGHRTIADALKTVVGTIPGFDGWRDHLGMRGVFSEGTFNSRMLWLVDGHVINDGYFQGASPGTTFPVDLAAVDRIEVVRGPASSLYGSNAFFGVINVVTRPAGKEGGSSITLGVGGFISSPDPHVQSSDFSLASQRFWSATLAESIGGARVLLSASRLRDEGRPIYVPYFTATGEGGIADRKDQTDSDKLLLDVQLGRWRLLAAFSDVRLVTPDASFGATPDSELNAAQLGYRFAELRHEAPIGEGLTLASRVYADYSAFVRDWFYEGYWPVDRQEAPATRVGIEERLTWARGANRLQAGVELQQLWTYQRENYPSEPFESFAEYSLLNWAAFAQDELELGERWYAVAGLRVEGNPDYGTIFTGRAALVFRPVEGTVLKLQLGQGFKNTLAHDYFYHSSVLNQFQWEIQKLGRERVDSIELVWSQLLAPFNLELTLFDNYIRDLVTYDNATDSYANAGQVDSLGVELELGWQVAARVSGYANATGHLTRSDGEPLFNSPAWSVKAGSAVKVLDADRLAVAVEGQLYGPSDFEDDPSRPGLELEQGTYVVLNANVSGRLVEGHVGWNAAVYNLTNTPFAYPVSKGTDQPFPGEGRSYRIGLDYRF